MYLKFSLTVCVRVLYSCFRASLGDRSNPRYKEKKKRRSVHQITPVTFFCFTYGTLFLSKCGYKGPIYPALYALYNIKGVHYTPVLIVVIKGVQCRMDGSIPVPVCDLALAGPDTQK